MVIKRPNDNSIITADEWFDLANCGIMLLELFLLTPLALLYKGFVLSRLWGWFVTTAIGWPTPTTAVCCGILLTAGLIRAGAWWHRREKLAGKELLMRELGDISRMFLNPSLSLLVAYIVLQFVP